MMHMLIIDGAFLITAELCDKEGVLSTIFEHLGAVILYFKKLFLEYWTIEPLLTLAEIPNCGGSQHYSF